MFDYSNKFTKTFVTKKTADTLKCNSTRAFKALQQKLLIPITQTISRSQLSMTMKINTYQIPIEDPESSRTKMRTWKTHYTNFPTSITRANR